MPTKSASPRQSLVAQSQITLIREDLAVLKTDVKYLRKNGDELVETHKEASRQILDLQRQMSDITGRHKQMVKIWAIAASVVSSTIVYIISHITLRK